MFTGFGDQISIKAAPKLSLSVRGPFAAQVPPGEDNLVMRAARLMAAGRCAAVSLRKNIPVCAGLGGGSSDAAAAMRLLSHLWGLPLPGPQKAAALGADLPVCLGGEPARVEGIGERILKLPPLPELHFVLANPGRMLPTGGVYAEAADTCASALPPLPRCGSAAALADWLRHQRNDLEKPAIRQCPAVAEILSALGGSRNCLLARMSGSGATCFGLFDTFPAARSAAAQLGRANPGWWVQATTA